MLRAKSLLMSGLAMLVALASCTKDVKEIITDSQTPGDNKSYLQFTAQGVPLTGEQLYAVLDVETKSGQPALTGKKLSLNYVQGAYKTDKVEIAKGEYKLTKFIIVKSSDTAVFATPKLNSAKAPQVTKPLGLDLLVTNTGIAAFATEVIKVELSDAPAAFGYASNDFGFHPSLKLKMHLKIEVGDVMYDSLPGILEIDAADNNNNHWIRQVDLAKGISSFMVPDNYSHYKFSIRKWNLVFEKTYTRAELSNELVIPFGGHKNPKRFVKAVTYRELPTGYQENSRTEYFYTGNALSDVRYYQRLPQYFDLQLINVYKFIRENGPVDTIKRFSPNGELNGFTAFTYVGKQIVSMHNRSYDQETFAAVQLGGSVDKHELYIDYLFSNGQSMTYEMKYSDRNKISYSARSSTGAGGAGTYEYDSNINPYYFIDYPDLYFTNSSKNNQLNEQSGHTGGFPSVVAYKFEYTYDDDGYPTSLVTSYKGYTTNEHLYRIKKVFHYQ